MTLFTFTYCFNLFAVRDITSTYNSTNYTAYQQSQQRWTIKINKYNCNNYNICVSSTMAASKTPSVTIHPTTRIGSPPSMS